MRLNLPISILQLTLIGFTIVVVPLIIALVNAIIKVDNLSQRMTETVYSTAQAVDASRVLLSDVISLERSARQYLVLQDPEILAGYEIQRIHLSTLIDELLALFDDEEIREPLFMLRQRENEMHASVLFPPLDAQEDSDRIEDLPALAELVRRAIDEGVDIVFLADDFAYNKGLFVEPTQFAQLWRPHFDRIFEPARNANKPILFHSDGRIDDAVEMLLDMGVDCLNPMDPSGVDYRDYKRRYGDRVTLSGNIDITWPLVKGTLEDVERDVKEHMDVLKPGGRWIAGSSHSIVNYIPHENFAAMINAIHKYGAY